MSAIHENVNKQYYENIEKLLIANDEAIRHPRTKQLIIGTSLLARKEPPKAKGKKHLCRFPRIAYHRRKNQKLRKGYRFILTAKGIQAQKFDKQTETWQNIPNNAVRFNKTAQYKTVWYSKHKRRM